MSRENPRRDRRAVQREAQVSHVRFWALLTTFLLVNLLIGRVFQWVVRTLDLDNSTRTLYREVIESGAGSLLENLAFNWLPQLLLVSLSCWLYLRLARVDVNVALSLGLRRHGPWVWALPLGLLLVLVYQFVVRSVVSDDPLGNIAAIDRRCFAFLAVYTLRFFPSALIEEMVFRGSIFTSLEKRYGMATAFAVSVLLFGLAHLYGGSWLFVNALVLGAGFTLVYAKTRSLASVTLLHLFSNVSYALLNYRC